MNHTDRYLSYVFVFVQFACLGLFTLTGSLIARNPVLLAVDGLAVLVGVWAIWSIRLSNFNITSNVRRGARLVTRGPYRYIRHPMYAALLLVTFVAVLDQFSMLRLAIWLVLLADLMLKLRHEEKLLARQVEGYSEYMQRSRRVLPFVF